jgi:hypothetical protein
VYDLGAYRRVLLSYARGLTLEVRSGIAQNAPYYRASKISRVLITDPY